MATPNEELTNLIAQLPDNQSAEDIVRELAFHVLVQRGLVDVAVARVVSNEDRRIRF